MRLTKKDMAAATATSPEIVDSISKPITKASLKLMFLPLSIFAYALKAQSSQSVDQTCQKQV
jgi:hypothetical protein